MFVLMLVQCAFIVTFVLCVEYDNNAKPNIDKNLQGSESAQGKTSENGRVMQTYPKVPGCTPPKTSSVQSQTAMNIRGWRQVFVTSDTCRAQVVQSRAGLVVLLCSEYTFGEFLWYVHPFPRLGLLRNFGTVCTWHTKHLSIRKKQGAFAILWYTPTGWGLSLFVESSQGTKNIRGHRMQRWRQLQPSSHEPRTRGLPEKNASPPQTRGLSRSLYSSSIILELFHNSMYMYLCSCRRLCLALHTIFHTANF